MTKRASFWGKQPRMLLSSQKEHNLGNIFHLKTVLATKGKEIPLFLYFYFNKKAAQSQNKKEAWPRPKARTTAYPSAYRCLREVFILRGHYRRKNRKVRLVLVLILLFTAAILFFAEKQFAPVILSMAKQQAQSYAVRNLQGAAQAQIATNEESFNYQSLMHIEKDSDGRIILMTPDTMRINMLVSAIVLDAEQSFHEIAEDEISVPLGLGEDTPLPVSAQLVGPAFKDRQLLTFARALERGFADAATGAPALSVAPDFAGKGGEL